MIKKVKKTDKDLVYYGPHKCAKCEDNGINGTMIIKVGNGAPDYLQFNFVHGSHYPNHKWKKHVCVIKNK